MKLQIALDYLIVFTFLLFIFILTFASIAKQRVLISNEQTFSQLQLAAQSVAADLSYAAQAGNGYSASVELPSELSILQYNLSITPEGMVVASSNVFGQIISASAFSLVQGVASNSMYLSPNRMYYEIPTLESSGFLNLQNSFGTICVDYTCPSTLNQSSRIILSDKVASSIDLNGYNTNAILSTPVTTSESESISFWLRPSVTSTTVPNYKFIVDQGEQIGLPGPQDNWIALSSGSVTGGPSSLALCGTEVLKPNNWYFITYTESTTSGLTIYVNANKNLGCTNPSAAADAQAPASLNIGISATEIPSSSFNGSIANMQFYSNTLTQTQVQTLYSEGLNGYPIYSANVAAWYPFQGNGNDYNGNALNNLQVNGPVLYPSVAQIYTNVYNASGTPLSNVSVGYIASSGSFSTGQSAQNQTNANGMSQAFLNQGNISDYASVKAVAFNGNSTTKANVIGWWPAVEGWGTVLHDVSSRSNTASNLNGNIMNGATWALPSTVAEFDGSTSYIQIPNYPALQSSTLTISAWVKYTGPSSSTWFRGFTSPLGQDFAISKSGAWEFGVCNQNLVVCVYNPATGSYSYTTSKLAPGQWYMLTETINSGLATMFVNGYRVSFISSLSVPTSNANGIQIGYAASGGNTLFFNGSISNLQIYGSVLSSQSIENLFQSGIGAAPYPATITGWWPLNGNANDYSGNGYNGIIFGNLNFAPLSQINTASSQQVPVLGAAFTGTTNILLQNSNSLKPNTNVVVTAWFSSTSLASPNPIFYFGSGTPGFGKSGYELDLDIGYPGFIVSPSGAGTCGAGPGYPINDGKLHFLAASYNGTNANFYIDGALTASATCTATSHPISYGATNYGLIGGDPGDTFTGSIYNVHVYNTTMTPSQIYQIYIEGVSGLPLQNEGLGGWWPLNGNGNDYSTNGNNGGLAGTGFNALPSSYSYLVPSLSGSGVYFNGTAGTVVSNTLSIPTKFTASVWVNPSNQNGFAIALGKGDTFTIGANFIGADEADFDGFLTGCSGPFCFLPSFIVTSPTLVSHQWYMLTGVYDGTTATLYVDGVPVNSMVAPGTIVSNSDPVVIGSAETYPYTGANFNGTIADAQIYNTALTPSQVYQLYNVGIPPTASATVPLGVN